jgi:DNA repair exonuclease SbcCD ATPase subunit
MNIAEQVSADSKMAQLPYTKILALLSAPPEDREELAEMAEGMSAAEIRRLTEERNKAAEAANMETARADQAERDAKAFNQENANLRNHVSVLQNELNKEKQHVDDIRARLLEAENNRVEVEVFPADYEELKRQQKELIEAAAEAEARAADAEAALEEARSENARNGISEYEKLHLAMKNFLMQCELMACNPAGLLGERDRALKDVERLQQWCEVMGEALKGVIPVKAVVL